MPINFRIGAIAIGLAAAATIVGAQGRDPLAAAVKARQAHMQLYTFNLTTLGGMARGNIEYDAATAQAAADNLVALTTVDQSAYWPPGSAAGEVDGSRALPAIWETFPAITDDGAEMVAAAAAMQEAAGVDLASLQVAMGTLGAACSGCHETYRQPN